jgi:hypothetical protein
MLINQSRQTRSSKAGLMKHVDNLSNTWDEVTVDLELNEHYYLGETKIFIQYY